MTAGLYAKRMGKRVLLLEGNNYGGQIASCPKVENYPAIKSLSGGEFADSLLDQILSLDVETEFENVLSVKKADNIFEVKGEYKTYQCKSIIIATGCNHRKLEAENCGVKSGISYCAVCDGAFYKGEDVAVIGGGDSALQEALYLSGICRKVYLIHRRDCFRGCAFTADKLYSQKNAEVVLCCKVSKIKGNGALEGIELCDTVTGEKREIAVKGLFVAIGQLPRTEIFKDIVNTDERGFIISGEDCKTSTEGIFVAGDCRTKNLRQLTTAVSDGAAAAINACVYVDSIKT